MIPIRGICVCVEYDDLLAVTLPRAMRHLTSCLVVTHPNDQATQEVVRSVHGARAHLTESFFEHGAHFNKGLAMEEGFDVMGREGWILVFDADTVLPDDLMLHRKMRTEALYGARRRMLEDASRWRPGLDWRRFPVSADRVVAGYFQLFHATASAIRERPWYDVTFPHAGGCDGYFQSRWRPVDKVYLGCEVLHLGPRDTNWFGRTTSRPEDTPADVAIRDARIVEMEKFLTSKGWRGRRRDPRVKITERVEVPGYSPTKFQLGRET